MRRLYSVPVLRIQLKIASLWKQDIDVTSLVIDQPHVFLLFRPDGTTNIPIAGGHREKLAIEELVDLRVGHFAINQGTVQTEFRHVPLTARGENLNAVLTYESRLEQYRVELSSHQLHVESDQTIPVAADLQLQAYLERNRLTVTKFSLQTPASRVSGDLSVTNFRNPVAEMQIAIQADVKEVGRVSELPAFTEGAIQITGNARYDNSSAFSFHGKMSAGDVGYHSRIFTLRHVRAIKC